MCRDLLMSSIEQVLPCGSNVGRVAVISSLIDQEAKVKVTGLVRVSIVQLFND